MTKCNENGKCDVMMDNSKYFYELCQIKSLECYFHVQIEIFWFIHHYITFPIFVAFSLKQGSLGGD